jgi:hypothetical protein
MSAKRRSRAASSSFLLSSTPSNSTCGGTTHGTMWEQYARMRDALNATGRPIYFSITQAEAFPDGHPRMHGAGRLRGEQFRL